MKQQKNYPPQMRFLKAWLEHIKIPAGLIFFVLGILSTIWFLIRVIPKPSRAHYPCMKAAAPFMSGFFIYLLTLGTSVFAFRKFRQKLYQSRYSVALGLLLLSIVSAGVYFIYDAQPSKAAILSNSAPPEGVNNPMGIAYGIKPGRVVWSWDSDATNAYCLNNWVYNSTTGVFDTSFYFSPENNDTNVINNLVSKAIINTVGAKTEEEAWDSIFHYFNRQKNGIDTGYQQGQDIFIKVNEGSMSWYGMFDPNDLSRIITNATPGNPAQCDIVETSPFVMYAVLKSLVYQAHVPQANIFIGEPMRNLYKDVYTFLHNDFLNVNYLGNNLQTMFSSLNLPDLGRYPVDTIGSDSIHYSTTTPGGDKLYDVYSYCSYVINIAALKGHYRAGVTLNAKNHFGSQARMTFGASGASQFHDSLVAPLNTDPFTDPQVTNAGYHKYRPQVDLMAHPDLGGKTVLYMVDGLYSGQDGYFANSMIWRMPPFNNNYPSSVFVSQDEVALESVCYDFLRNEYDGTGGRSDCPNYVGVDDYLHQAADSSNWPSYIKYKPDGIHIIGSLGVHEHWNNAIDKQYTRNLDPVNGKGIELYRVLIPAATKNTIINNNNILTIFPNPASHNTNISYTLSDYSNVLVEIYTQDSKMVTVLCNQPENQGQHTIEWNFNEPQGIYICKLTLKNSSGTSTLTGRIEVIK